MPDPYKTRMFSALTGNSFGTLDSWDGNLILDGYIATVVTSTGVYWYRMNATSGASLLSPFRIPPVSDAGAKCWHLVGTSARMGALVKLTSDQSIETEIETDISWSATEYDDASFWAGGSPTKLTIPIGVTGIKIQANVGFDPYADATSRRIRLFKNDSGYTGFPFKAVVNGSGQECALNIASATLPVSAADYFEVSAKQSTGGYLNVDGNPIRTWFSIKAVNFA